MSPSQLLRVGPAIWAIAALAVSPFDDVPLVRVPIVLGFALLGPGLAWIRHVPVRDVAVGFGLAVTASLVATGLMTFLVTHARLDPVGGLVGLAALALAGAWIPTRSANVAEGDG